MTHTIGKLVCCTCCTLLCLEGGVAYSAEAPQPANAPLVLGADTEDEARPANDPLTFAVPPLEELDTANDPLVLGADTEDEARPANDPLTVGVETLEEFDTANDTLVLGADILEQDMADASAADRLVGSEGVNRERLASQTVLLGGLCVVTAVGLYSMPSSITGWDHDAKISRLPSQWWDNVSRRPIWDTDSFFFNYIAHPYVGGVYYQMARKSGYGQGGSLLYSALMSTFFWEYGVEAFAERPSIQDLFITPLAGWAVGEWAFRTEKKIVANEGRVLGSEILGEISLFMMDPMSRIGNGINRLVGQEWILTGTLAPQSAHASYASNRNHTDDFSFQAPMLILTLKRQF